MMFSTQRVAAKDKPQGFAMSTFTELKCEYTSKVKYYNSHPSVHTMHYTSYEIISSYFHCLAFLIAKQSGCNHIVRSKGKMLVHLKMWFKLIFF